MPRAAKDTKLDTREARSRLKIRREPYWRSVMPGLFLGYRRGKTGGVWIARARQGSGYAETRLGIADDASPTGPDGEVLLTYAQATDSAILFAKTATAPKPPRTYGQGCTVKDAVDEYLKDLAKRRPGSSGIATARQQADRYILPKLGDRLVGSLKTKELSDFVKAVAASPATVRGKGDQKRVDRKDYDLSDPAVMRARFETAKRVWTTLRAALTHAWREEMDGVKDDDQWRKVKLQPPSVEEQPPRMLDEAEVQALLAACKAPDLRLLIEAALHTGARLGEITSMQARDFQTDAVAIRQTKPINPKTLHQPLTTEGATFFKKQAEGKAPTDLLFLRADGSPWEKSQHAKAMTKALTDAGIADASFKTLRATYGKRLLIATGDLEKVRQALGHADQRITRKHYAQFLKDEMAAGIAMLPAINAGATDAKA
jgi:integrase